MRSPSASLLLLVVLFPLVGLAAGSAAASKRAQSRAEADAVLAQVSQGGPVPAAASRLRYLREEPYAAERIGPILRETFEERIRRNLVSLLASLGARQGESTLAKLAGDGDSTVRMYAAQGLAKLGSRNTAAVLPLLNDKSAGVRREAARALGASRNPKMGKRLMAAAKAEQDLEVRAALLEAAGTSGDAKQKPGLKAYLDSDSESTRFAAARGLCRLGAPEGFGFAQKLLGSPDKFVRRQGLALFEGVPAKKASPVLSPLLKDADRALAASSARMLHQGGDAGALDWLVLASWNAKGEEKLTYEKELETLQLADDRRKAILRKAGVAP
ncbi:HEAT repeat domain-containing protein [Corallococcus sp. bb12-1]|uniref:HEAT repeat domain-containing protein n=1 Tax=Corallococcus sp. bb12-1 TaxID=2996784 RepID=UPI00226E8893|nr:HEAT repeat domain-containing protein [Corallococcus sp. bb12-1]MCY1046029.1 HEAT repeat domain-containing protein [Corallococcus sp. bb12-1]